MLRSQEKQGVTKCQQNTSRYEIHFPSVVLRIDSLKEIEIKLRIEDTFFGTTVCFRKRKHHKKMTALLSVLVNFKLMVLCHFFTFLVDSTWKDLYSREESSFLNRKKENTLKEQLK